MKKTFVIGDIHGAYKALLQVIERAGVSPTDKLIFLGDYVDGWSQSFEVIDYLANLSQQMECEFIRGNHDLWCQQWLEKNLLDEVWINNGGKATCTSYGNRTNNEKLQHLNFLQRTQHFIIDNHNRLFIHAGFSSMHGPYNEHYSSNYSWDRSLWEMAVSTDDRIEKSSLRYPKRLLLFNEIYIGHTPTQRYGSSMPMKAANVWNVDTGVAFTGRLSIMDVHSKQYWQSDAVQELYPGETGRNTI